MSQHASGTIDSTASEARIVTILTRKQVLEIWHIYLQRTSYRERDVELPAEMQIARVDGKPVRRDVYRRQLHRQQWGRFIIQRYQATRMLPWTPSIGLAMLIPGTLLAAGSANSGLSDVPLSMFILQSALITLGGVLAIGSGWRILTQRVHSAGGEPVESLGVSGHALGFPKDVTASDALPGGFRAGRFRGLLEVDIPLGEWQVAEEYTSELGWNPVR